MLDRVVERVGSDRGRKETGAGRDGELNEQRGREGEASDASSRGREGRRTTHFEFATASSPM